MNPEVDLAVKRERRLKPIDGPGLSWLLIVLVLFLTALSIRLLQKRDTTDSPEVSPGPQATDSSDSQIPRVYNVSYKGGVFSPTNLRIRAGDTVRFKNDGFFAIHIASDPDQNNLPGLDSVGEIPQGSYFSFTFTAKGIFGYYNKNGTSQEKGTVIVR